MSPPLEHLSNYKIEPEFTRCSSDDESQHLGESSHPDQLPTGDLLLTESSQYDSFSGIASRSSLTRDRDFLDNENILPSETNSARGIEDIFFNQEPTELSPPMAKHDRLTDDEQVLFESPSLLGAPDATLPLKEAGKYTSALGKQSIYFRKNYRRFVVFLIFAAFVASPLLFFGARWMGFLYPMQVTLFLLTGVGAVACIIFYIGPYKNREIAIDNFGIYYEDELRTLYISWEEIEAIHLHAVEAFFNPYPLCYVRVKTTQGDEFAFANFGGYLFGVHRHISFGNPPYPIIDIKDSDLLLVIIVQQAKNAIYAPDLERLRFRAQTDLSLSEEDEESSLRTSSKNPPNQSRFGFWILLLKLGSKFALSFGRVGIKFIQMLPKGLKFAVQSVKPMYAGASLGLYAAFFRWEFAVLLCVVLIVHELGHVWAMKQEGMKIKGVYMIPFFGAATVTDDSWPSWHAQAKVNLAGPLWGTYCTLGALMLYWLFPSPFWIALALWSALINFLNLLPVNPLDGGRILNSIAYSLHSSFGFLLTLTLLVVGLLISLSLELLLLYILCLFGIGEFFREYALRQRANKIALIDNYGQLTAREGLLFKSITGINFGDRNTPHILEHEEILFKRLRLVLHAPTMNQKQMLSIGFTTAILVFSLLGFIIFLSTQYPQEASWAIRLFR